MGKNSLRRIALIGAMIAALNFNCSKNPFKKENLEVFFAKQAIPEYVKWGKLDEYVKSRSKLDELSQISWDIEYVSKDNRYVTWVKDEYIDTARRLNISQGFVKNSYGYYCNAQIEEVLWMRDQIKADEEYINKLRRDTKVDILHASLLHATGRRESAFKEISSLEKKAGYI